jgi:hypothetical protein
MKLKTFLKEFFMIIGKKTTLLGFMLLFQTFSIHSMANRVIDIFEKICTLAIQQIHTLETPDPDITKRKKERNFRG